MDYQIHLSNNKKINLKDTNIDVKEFTATLNDHKVNFVDINNVIISKHNIIGIFPTDTVEGDVINENTK